MSRGGPLSERTLVLAPTGRDAAIALSILREADLYATICADLPELVRELTRGAAVAVAVEEALSGGDLTDLSRWIENQPAWSDFPFVLLAQRGGGLERNPGAKRLSTALGNVSFLERPFHPTTLVSVVRTALRGRLRQYEARERIEEIRRAEAQLELRVEERTAELEAANRQLADQIAEREKAEKALRQAQRLEAVGQLTSGVAHDFNNLLMVVLGNIRQMQKTTADAATLRRLSMMAEAAERGAKLTAQMLAFSRRQKLEPRVVDLNDTVRGMRDLLQSTMGGSTRIETRLGQALWPAMADPTQIELVVLNLAINARDAMEVGGTLTVETGNCQLGEPRRSEEPAAGDYVMVAVSDTGSGMTEDVLAKAFEPFFTTKPVGAGSGLGLSQVFGLAKQSGGGVAIDTELGRGTTVRVYLPRAVAACRQEASASPPPPPIRAKDGATVLVVDDDAAVREITAGILRDLGYRIVEAGSGGAALRTLDSRKRIDAVLLDFAMPGMNGAEVAREIVTRRPGVPILFATGYADAGALVEASEDHIVHKPFVDGELAEKLARALQAFRLGEVAAG
ncbi:signal transduction histidine kinase [Caulobacter ginsengisoli]|uniref:histidine kinase n=1 Tax=Caulobacter ginsengisoli TaxID=400775 RepID=A0ABU0IUR1_9CAUL|nr:response regulator [Caulobacter ginsengisoli]MDQ0464687.1 signal transduction histidine kinase [Caulobacter ginsengisoli]